MLNGNTEDPLEISIHGVRSLLKEKTAGVHLVDIREHEELAVGFIDTSVSIPNSALRETVQHVLPDKNAPLILYCASGARSLRAATALKGMGYQDVRSMAGGFNAWVEAGFDIKTKGVMTTDQIKRYSRQLLMPEIGEQGQLRLLRSRVLVVGAGGLGSPVAFYLAAAGVGTLGIVDFDRVDLSNLHRQILYDTKDVGQPKTASARRTIHRINPDISVIAYQERFTADRALEIIAPYDIVVDGSDNFGTKFLANDAAFFAGKPFVFGGAIRFEGQASVFFPKAGGPCLRCMMPEIPAPETAPS